MNSAFTVFRKILVILILFLSVNSVANAVVVVFAVRGVTQESQSGNPWELEPDDIVSASGTFDDSVLTTGTGSVFLDDVGNGLDLTIGSQTYTADDDDAFGSGSPLLEFSNGQLVNLSFTITSGNEQLVSSGGSLVGTVVGGAGFTGTWDFSSYEIVPVPAAVWLFGSALGLLGWITRKTG